jgi:hypothetical protein
MVVPRPALPLLFLSLALAPACSHPPQPVTAAKPASPAPAAGETAAAPASATLASATPASPAAKPEPAKDGRVVVVDPGDDAANHPKSLVEAAREEKERRAHAGEPVAVITNKTLPYSKGQLTFAQPAKKTAAEKEAVTAASVATAAGKNDKGKEAVPGEAHNDTYWRKRGLEIRQRLHQAAEEIARLEQDVADLRQRFYSEPDFAKRDTQVKPEWDRSLDRLRRKKDEVEATRKELDAFLEEGRKAGALPGWLREGAELEPPIPPPPPAPNEAVEPKILPEGPP